MFPSSVSALHCQRLPLYAVKPNSNKKKTKPASLGGTGFGTAPKPSADVKVRAVSGFSGSGTKPLRQAANTFDELLKEQQKDGNSCVSDVYVRSPLNDKTLFWFVGKVARCTIVDNLKGASLPTAQEAVISQKRLILEYAKRELRPQNMGGPFEKGLELWLAPGNSEMDVVQNKVSLVKVEGSLSTLADGFHVGDVGYNPEIYVGDEVQKGGLRVVRDEQGHPIKPVFEVNEAQ
ncbi:hypothetical protein MHU86_3682 [Fragilaria crotonensis]|nr:hypothetical protein MHU86_3682 [Fragilaria crotonensis]